MKRSLMENGEGKPDANTLLLLHFDGDFKDSSKNEYVITSSATFQDGKFKQSAGFADINMPGSIFSNVILHDFTIDYWYKVPGDNASHNTLLGWDGGGMLYSAVRISLNRKSGGFFLEYNTGNSHGNLYEKIFDDELTKDFHHAAFVRKGNRFMLFIDGILIIDIINNNSSVIGSNRTRNAIVWMDKTIIDEFRISNIARWTSDFTPPTKPY